MLSVTQNSDLQTFRQTVVRLPRMCPPGTLAAAVRGDESSFPGGNSIRFKILAKTRSNGAFRSETILVPSALPEVTRLSLHDETAAGNCQFSIF